MKNAGEHDTDIAFWNYFPPVIIISAVRNIGFISNKD